MNEIKMFEGHEVEIIEFNEQILFNPYHVGVCLEMAAGTVKDHIRRMNDNQVVKLKNSDVGLTDIRKLNNAGENFLTESGVYKLTFKSRKPNAERFTDWVADEVLPSINHNGGYIMNQEQKTDEEILAEANLVAQRVIAKRDERIKALEIENQKMQPKAEYFDALVDKEMLTSIRDTAKEFNMRPKDLMEWLLSKNYIYRKKPSKNNKKGRIMPYSEFTDGQKSEPLFSLKEFATDYYADSAVYVTPKGRATFRVMLKAEGMI